MKARSGSLASSDTPAIPAGNSKQISTTKEYPMNAMIGDNLKAEKERRVLISHYHRIDRDIAAKMKSLGAKKKENRLNAKASQIPSSQLDHLLKAFNTDDDQKPVDKLKRDMENLVYLGLIPDQTIKGDLFTQGDRVDQEAMVRGKGFYAGLNALDRVSGYDAGSSDDKLWLTSYDAGKSEYDTVLPDLMTRIQAEASKEAPEPDGDDPFAEADAQ
jgi:hypothetical protein